MDKYPLNESAWKRGWARTKNGWTSWQFLILDVGVGGLIGGFFQWYLGVGVVVFGMLCVWIGATASAPVLQRNETRKLVKQQAENKIIVSCETYYGNLRIANNVNTADFRAKAQRIEEGEPVWQDWFIKWKDSLEIDTKIFKGDYCTLEVASCESMYGMKNGVQSRRPYIRFYKVPQLVFDEDTGERIIEHNDLLPRITSVEVEITIFSQPDLGSPFKKRYLVKLLPDEDTVSIEEITR